ncbi:Electron transfer flavoprotein small subunit [Candidatus Hodgkinia cicadicola]|nr:Electron transfer flavoprotein small subunit [Candidatus Hodgkinia cicadicola]
MFKRALLLGADNAVLIKRISIDSLDTAALIRRLITLENYELALLSNSASDNAGGQTAPTLASLLGWPRLSNAPKLVFANGHLRALCLSNRERVWFEIGLPCTIACNERKRERGGRKKKERKKEKGKERVGGFPPHQSKACELVRANRCQTQAR